MKIQPIGDKVVIERLEAEEMTKGGIVLPDAAKEKPKQGKIVAVGPGRLLDDGGFKEPDVKEGELVIFQSYAGTEVDIDGKTLLIMSEDDILCVVE